MLSMKGLREGVLTSNFDLYDGDKLNITALANYLDIRLTVTHSSYSKGTKLTYNIPMVNCDERIYNGVKNVQNIDYFKNNALCPDLGIFGNLW